MFTPFGYDLYIWSLVWPVLPGATSCNYFLLAFERLKHKTQHPQWDCIQAAASLAASIQAVPLTEIRRLQERTETWASWSSFSRRELSIKGVMQTWRMKSRLSLQFLALYKSNYKKKKGKKNLGRISLNDFCTIDFKILMLTCFFLPDKTLCSSAILHSPSDPQTSNTLWSLRPDWHTIQKRTLFFGFSHRMWIWYIGFDDLRRLGPNLLRPKQLSSAAFTCSDSAPQ